MAGTKLSTRVSPEMLSFVGTGAVPRDEWPDAPVLFAFSGLGGEDGPTLACGPDLDADDLSDATLVLVVERRACLRIFDMVLDEDGRWHLPSELRAMVLAIRDHAVPGLAAETLRLAKSIELLCAVFARLRDDTLVTAAGNAALSEPDVVRIAAARRMVSEQWQQKLTLDGIARACGLNRSKLARGFRALYDCSVADALTERRLTGARQLLQSTDLPVKAIGYRCGYLNNASFTRAFSRHYGVAPTRFRAGAMAA